MKLFRPDKKNQFVFAVVGKGDRDGAGAKYMSQVAASIDEALDLIIKQGFKPAAPHCMGRYDEFGRYCTYCPPIDGVTPGKFVLHPMADADRKREEFYA